MKVKILKAISLLLLQGLGSVAEQFNRNVRENMGDLIRRSLEGISKSGCKHFRGFSLDRRV